MRQRVLIDIEFAVDEAQFKAAHLAEDVTGVSDVTDAEIRNVVAVRLISADWAGQGLAPQRSSVITRLATAAGEFVEVVVPADPGVMPAL